MVPHQENNYEYEVTFEPEENLTYVEYTDSGILQVLAIIPLLMLIYHYHPYGIQLPIKTAPLVIINLYRGGSLSNTEVSPKIKT